LYGNDYKILVFGSNIRKYFSKFSTKRTVVLGKSHIIQEVLQS
jgi:hypothetical protein